MKQLLIIPTSKNPKENFFEVVFLLKQRFVPDEFLTAMCSDLLYAKNLDTSFSSPDIKAGY